MYPRREFLRGALATGLILGAPACRTGSAADPTRARAAKPLRLLILGGTRFLGPALVEAARARGHHLTLFNRGKSNPGLYPQRDRDIQQIHGDRDGDLRALAGLRFDAVIDTSGFVPRLVGATAALLKDAVQQYVFISSISVYKDTSGPIDESTAVVTLADPTVEKVGEGTYGGLKALCEQVAERTLPGRVINIRPGYIIGPRDGSDRFTYWPLRVERGGEMLVPGTPADPMQVIDVRDLAAWTVLLIERRRPGVYNAVGPEQELSMQKVLTTCEQATGGAPRYTWVDDKFLEAQKVELPIWSPPRGESAGFLRVSVRRAVAEGLTYRPLLSTVRDTLTWWRGLPAERRAKPRAGLTPEREAELLQAWHKQAPKTTDEKGAG